MSRVTEETSSRENATEDRRDPLAPVETASALVRVLDDYMAQLQAGRAPDRSRLLADHPDLAADLERCLAGIDFIHRAIPEAGGAPARLGDFRILREVGRGGMGVVYEAEQVSLRRTVALKVLRYGTLADETALLRFRREAETVAQLHHTNIVPIHAVGTEGGVHYFAMQFIAGPVLGGPPPGGAVAGQGSGAPRRGGLGARKPPRRWRTPTSAGSSTVTSSRRTCCSTPTESSG